MAKAKRGAKREVAERNVRLQVFVFFSIIYRRFR